MNSKEKSLKNHKKTKTNSQSMLNMTTLMESLVLIT